MEDEAGRTEAGTEAGIAIEEEGGIGVETTEIEFETEEESGEDRGLLGTVCAI